MGKVCVVGCAGLEFDAKNRTCRIGGKTLREGDVVSLDGNEGCVYSGALEMVTERPERELKAIAAWSESKSLRVGPPRNVRKKAPPSVAAV
jgi:pyruvate,orthophosphate dikinase